jgi:hypothetical protein
MNEKEEETERIAKEEVGLTVDSKNYFVIFANELRFFFVQELPLNIVLTLLETSEY